MFMNMKRVIRLKGPLTLTALGLCAAFLLTGCLAFQVGGDKSSVQPSVGQQLVDLKKARDSGAMTEAEYECQRAKLVGT